jgi:hypothetical protein
VVAHSKANDMPSNIMKDLIKKLLDCYYDDNTSKIPMINYLTPPFPTTLVKSSIYQGWGGGSRIPFPHSHPLHRPWVGESRWSSPRALLASIAIIRGSSYTNNPIRCLLTSCTGQKVVVHLKSATPTSIEWLHLLSWASERGLQGS